MTHDNPCLSQKKNKFQEADSTRSLINITCKRWATFFGHVMKREKQENLVTSGMLEIKTQQGKTAGKDVVFVSKSTRSDEGYRCVEGHDSLR